MVISFTSPADLGPTWIIRDEQAWSYYELNKHAVYITLVKNMVDGYTHIMGLPNMKILRVGVLYMLLAISMHTG